jgi:GTP-binding protein 1
MTSLRTFQHEIDEIHTRELAKQRAQTVADREKEKENKIPKPKGKAKDDGFDNPKSDSGGRAGMLDVEENILVNFITLYSFS